MTYADMIGLPSGTVVTAVQPCDAVEYSWVRTHGDKADVLQEGQTDGRVLVHRPDVAPADQHKYLFVNASQYDLA